MPAARLALAALVCAPGAALGQGFSHPPGLSPTVTPAMIRPAAWGGVGPRFAPRGAGYYRGGYGGLGGYGYGGFGGYGYGGYLGTDPYFFPPPFVGFDTPVAVPLVAAPGFIPDTPPYHGPIAGEVTIDFPADATVTVDGTPAPGAGPTHTLTTRPLKPGETATLALKATWTRAGDRYEWARAVTLGRGDRSRLSVFGGTRAR